MRYYLLLALAFLATACNPYQQFYKPYPITPYLKSRCLYNDGEPEIRQVAAGEARAVMSNLIANGYVPIGESNFNAAGASDGMLASQAKKIRAYLAVYYSAYTNTENGAMPFTTPNVSTIYSSGTVSAGGGTGSYSGSSTSYGTTTNYIPYSVNRYEYCAMFFGKRRHGGLGLYVREPTSDDTAKNGTNQGLVVRDLVKGEAAFNADILVNDTILKIGTEPISDIKKYIDVTTKYVGQKHVQFELLRRGHKLTKFIDIGN